MDWRAFLGSGTQNYADTAIKMKQLQQQKEKQNAVDPLKLFALQKMGMLPANANLGGVNFSGVGNIPMGNAGQLGGMSQGGMQNNFRPKEISVGTSGINQKLERVPTEEEKIIGLKDKQKDTLATEGGKLKSGVEQSKSVSEYNLSLVSENMNDMASVLADAYREGGAGNKLKSSISSAARGGWLPERTAELYPQSAAFPGKKFEIISKAFPMLTQQIGKEGSVRLIESIFSKFGQSLPGTETAPKLAVSEMQATIMSMYRVRRAMENINMDAFDLNTDAGKNSFANKVVSIANNIEIKGEEKEALDLLTQKALKPLTDYIAERDGNIPASQNQLSNSVAPQLMIDANGNKAWVYPNGKIVEAQ
jgi:hypothetical protein